MESAGCSREKSRGSMSAYQTDPRVDQYIRTLPAWQQDIARQVRDVVHTADPDEGRKYSRSRRGSTIAFFVDLRAIPFLLEFPAARPAEISRFCHPIPAD